MSGQRPRVLFLGGGRRVELAYRFVLRGCDVVGYETEQHTPLGDEFEAVVGLPWSHPDFGQHLSDTCDAYGIKAVVPLQDGGVVALADVALPAGVEKVCSPRRAALTAYDKLLFEQFCLEHFPANYPAAERGLSAVIKPRFGFGSKDVRTTEEFVGLACSAYVAQAELPEPEYTVDCYFAKCGGFVGACPRWRIRFAGGEVVESETVEDDRLVTTAKELGLGMGLRGPACFQFRYGDGEEPQVIECNARLGGGSTLSCEAGLNLVDYIVTEYVEGRPIVGPPTIRRGVRLNRSFRDHFSCGAAK